MVWKSAVTASLLLSVSIVLVFEVVRMKAACVAAGDFGLDRYADEADTWDKCAPTWEHGSCTPELCAEEHADKWWAWEGYHDWHCCGDECCSTYSTKAYIAIAIFTAFTGWPFWLPLIMSLWPEAQRAFFRPTEVVPQPPPPEAKFFECDSGEKDENASSGTLELTGQTSDLTDESSTSFANFTAETSINSEDSNEQFSDC